MPPGRSFPQRLPAINPDTPPRSRLGGDWDPAVVCAPGRDWDVWRAGRDRACQPLCVLLWGAGPWVRPMGTLRLLDPPPTTRPQYTGCPWAECPYRVASPRDSWPWVRSGPSGARLPLSSPCRPAGDVSVLCIPRTVSSVWTGPPRALCSSLCKLGLWSVVCSR